MVVQTKKLPLGIKNKWLKKGKNSQTQLRFFIKNLFYNSKEEKEHGKQIHLHFKDYWMKGKSLQKEIKMEQL